MLRLSRDRTMVAKEDLPAPGSRRFCVAEAADAVAAGKPLLYLRFSDGELVSIFRASRGKWNTDKSRWLPGTLGEELHACLEWAAETDDPVRVELARCWNQWPAMREWLAAMPPDRQARFSTGQVWPDALISGAVYPLIENLHAVKCRKVVLAEALDEPFAEAIGAELIACPKPDAYLALDGIVPPAREILDGQPGIVLASIGMASEPALWRLWDGRSVMLDIGHMPDALLGHRVRRSYLRNRELRTAVAESFRLWRARE